MTKSPLAETVTEYLQTECGRLEASPVTPGLYRATIIRAGSLPGAGICVCARVLQIALPQFLDLKAFLHPKHNPPYGHPLAGLLGCFHDVGFVEDRVVATLRVCMVPPAQRLVRYLGRLEEHSGSSSHRLQARITLDLTVAIAVEPTADGQRPVHRILCVKRALVS